MKDKRANEQRVQGESRYPFNASVANEKAMARFCIGDVPIHCAFDEIVSIDSLKPNPKNPNTHPDSQLKLLAKIIQKTGWRAPITVSKLSGFIVKGHGRLYAAQYAGFKECPVEYQNFENEEEELSALLADNKLAELAEIDTEKLGELFNEFEFSDLDMTGYSQDEFENLIGEFESADIDVSDDIVPDIEENPFTQSGDIWQLGEHRLMCGDSTKVDDVEKLMNGELADMVFTDPPYGMKKEKDGVLNDNLNFEDLLEFNKQWIPLTFANTKENGSWYCWGIDEPLMDIYSNILKPMIKENKITFRNLITWDKGSGQGQLSEEFRMYPIADEKCLFVQCGINCLILNADQYWEEYEPIRKYLYEQRIKCGWDIPTMKTIAGHSDKSRDHWTSKSQWNLPTKDVYLKFQQWAKENNVKAFQKEYEQLRAEYEQLRSEYEQLRSYFDNTHDNMNNVWHFPRTSQEERKQTGGHATPKPIALCSRAIKSSSRENETVLDVFGGSGSTLIACDQLNRKCYTMELDEKYCDVIVKRFLQFHATTEVKCIRGGVEVEWKFE